MNPLLKDFNTTIQTQRLLIRPFQAGDGAIINQAILESFDTLKQWMPWAQTEVPAEETELHVRNAVADWIVRKRLEMAIFDGSGQHFIGATGFHDINWDAGCLETGYWVRSSCAGKGYITEAVGALAQYAFNELGMNRLEIRCDVRNTKSRAVPERLGFTQEAILKKNALTADGKELRDTVVYARFKPEQR